ncbi:MAG: Flp pilus assembly complex ATPase component TadA [Nanoarchaeota archaeon]|nr:Flp pilus assembly complex ATPase component TadA [Nanoarchaeota archaeon]
MLFKQGTKLYDYEVQRESGQDVMYINYVGFPKVPSLADSSLVMARTVDSLIESPRVSKIVFVQQKNYVYTFSQISLLLEISNLYNYLVKQEKILSSKKLAPFQSCTKCLPDHYNSIRWLVLTLLKQDPIGCYVETKRILREEKINLEKLPAECRHCQNNFIKILSKMMELLEKTRLVTDSEEYLTAFHVGNREIYKRFFRPDVVPNFTFTRLMSSIPHGAELLDEYTIEKGYDKSTVSILKMPNVNQPIYHLNPPEFALEEEFYSLIDLARNVLVEHRPKAEEFTDPQRTRQIFFNISRDLLQELAETKKISLNYRQLNKLATILVRHTIGFGLIEVLLQDENLQDIVLNSPIGQVPAFVRHQKFDECSTNIIPSIEDADAFAARFRMLSGRPLDEANPVLDTDLEIENMRARIAIIQQPLSPDGLAYAFRRHREMPWTLPLFIKNKMMNPLSAGLMSFLVDGGRTILVAGTRSAGKCVSGDSLIQLSNGDIKAIKELEHGKQEKISDGYLFYPNPKINVLSLNNKNYKSDNKTVNAFWRREAPKTLVKITTNSGKEIITTPEHPYFTFDNNLKSTNAGDLKAGELIASPRKIDVKTETVLIPEAAEIISQIRTNATKISFPEKVNEMLAEFLGYLIGDGHIDEYKIEFTNSDIILRMRFAELSKKLFSVRTREIKSRNTYNIQITSRILNRALSRIFEIPMGNKASIVQIPSKILKSNNKILAAFLRAYFDCDGSIYGDKREIELATASKIMAKQLQMTLLRFEVISFLKKREIKGRDYYKIFIRGQFVSEFIKKIGFNHPSKKKRSENLTMRSWIDNTNMDIIPGGNFLLKELRKNLRVNPLGVRKLTTRDYWAHENNQYNATRKWFKILVEFYQKRFNEIEKLNNEISHLDENSDMGLFKKFRQILNIQNSNLTGDLSIGTISNFFNNVYKPRIKTKKLISEKIKEIHKKIISKGSKDILNNSFNLANSDVFWDRVKSVEKVDSKEKWVYDFTVEPYQNFVANGFFAHNTSLLGSLMLEIMPRTRVIVIEDSVTGDAGMIVKENGRFRKTTIGKLIDEKIEKNGFLDIDGREKEINVDNVEIFSVNGKGKVVLSKASKFIRHKVNKPIYEIRTTSGKKVKVTEDHSLFTLDEKKILRAIKSKELKEGDFIAIPSRLPFTNSLENINLLEDIDTLKKINKNLFVLGKGIEIYVKENRKELFNLGYSLGYKKSTIQNWTIKKILPLGIFEKIKEKINNEDLYLKGDGASGKIPIIIELDEMFLNFIGLWLADGCYDQGSVIISVEEKENKEVVKKIADRLGFSVKIHSDKFSSMINSSLLKEIMQKLLGLNGNSYTKGLPEWAYNLSDKQAGALLKGFFSGDGCASDKEVTFSSCSKELVEGITSLLLRFGIILRKSAVPLEPKNTPYGKDNALSCRIGSTIMINKFKENIGFLTDFKQERLDKLCARLQTHDISDVIPLSLEVKEELSEILGEKFNKHDYIIRENNLGRAHLTKMLEVIPKGVYTNPIDCLRGVVKAEIFWDKVKSAKKVSEEGYVYDISVHGNENFICENIVAHNTLEMPVDSMRKIGYNILRMKVRSALLKETAEMPADEGIRTSLRLGDSSLIVGEVRSVEAKALYEAMRIGALANVVAGTIHGASPYAIFDRVVNDLGVPITSFKATDIILVANPIKTPDGLHSKKRVVSLTEVGKNWTKDPLEEKGFTDLMKYNVHKDELEPTADLINGESEIIKSIAGSVKGWAGNWDAIWDNITLRARIKEELVNQSIQHSMPQLIEAPFVVKSNNAFHQFSDKVSKEVGLPEGRRVFRDWNDWFKNEIKKAKI